jgi:type VII secretion effector (TIGR04197 family)
MATVKSSVSLAKQVTNRMTAASESALGIEDSSKLATNTTVIGNNNAKSSITRTINCVNKISSLFSRDSRSVYSLAQQFDFIDTKYKHRLTRNK